MSEVTQTLQVWRRLLIDARQYIIVIVDVVRVTRRPVAVAADTRRGEAATRESLPSIYCRQRIYELANVAYSQLSV